MHAYPGAQPQPTSAGFGRLILYGFRQFGFVNIDLNNQLTVLTGTNGAGKTSLLNVLGSHFNWSSGFRATPAAASLKYGGDFFDLSWNDLANIRSYLSPEILKSLTDSGVGRIVDPSGTIEERKVGVLSYREGDSTDVAVHVNKNQPADEYHTYFTDQRIVEGLFFPAFRTPSAYRPVERIPARFASSEQILLQHIEEVRSKFSQYSSSGSSTPMLRMKEALLAAAIYGEGNSSVVADAEARDVWEGFQSVLRKVLPESIGFSNLVAFPPDILLVTRTGSFAIDSISGGMNALFEFAWQIFLRSRHMDSFTVCIDEPENHLHPSLQRRLMPSLMSAFPNVSFVLATHSPFVVTASPDARVYVLTQNNANRVDSAELDFVNKAQTAEKTLTDVLGVRSTAPIWAEERYNKILERFLTKGVSAASLRALKGELEENGIGHELPDAVERLLREVPGAQAE
jgi:energy-coupling factor transporter ATP-binding protein EcfA2